ncbi:hypothetical protein BD560DRAFT_413424 [Blakeslea trispora]|nr:hypothetical protein BD560DRAFT_413424 [Blakeslea trispora]
MNSSFYQHSHHYSAFDQVNTLPCELYDHSFFSKLENPISPAASLEQFNCISPPTTWDIQQHNQANFSDILFSDLSLPAYDSPEHALNALLQEHHVLAPTQQDYNYSSPLLSATDAIKYAPLSPASMNSFDSFDYVASDSSAICFPQTVPSSKDHQMPQIYQHEIMGNSNQESLTKQPSYSLYQINHILTPKEQLYLPIERQAPKKSRRRTHPSQLQCTICFKTFSRPYNLKSHQRTHTKERPYCCTHPNCGWTFARPHDLKRHEFLHSGIKPHVCSCGKKFSRSDAFKRHQTVDAGCASLRKRKPTSNSNL